MKLVAVSILKNEADVVEAFVRHTAAWADAHLLFDHASTDGTREIVAALAREGLPVSLFSDPALGNLQQARSNHLMRLAATAHGADWVLPLDADEFLVAPDRATLEQALGPGDTPTPLSLPMGNYYPAPSDDPTEPNPARRLRQRVPLADGDRKVFLPRTLAADPTVLAAKGNHAALRAGTALPDRPAPDGIWLAHLPQRSLSQQTLRIVTAHLQKLSAGQAQAGVDLHYAPLFDFLRQHPALFPATLSTYPERLQPVPLPYRGGALRYSAPAGEDWPRVARALLPFLENLARSHGHLTDLTAAAAPAALPPPIEPIPLAAVPPPGDDDAARFTGFTAPQGLGPPEGPFPPALLPAFRWGLAPSTVLEFVATPAHLGRLEFSALTHRDDQVIHLECNGAVLLRHRFAQTHRATDVTLTFPLVPGLNRLVLHYERSLQTAADPRPLAVLFTRLRIA